jgi:hypothetical protein
VLLGKVFGVKVTIPRRLRDKSVHDVMDTERGRFEAQSPGEGPRQNTNERREGPLMIYPFRETNDQDWHWDQQQKRSRYPMSASREGGKRWRTVRRKVVCMKYLGRCQQSSVREEPKPDRLVGAVYTAGVVARGYKGYSWHDGHREDSRRNTARTEM